MHAFSQSCIHHAFYPIGIYIIYSTCYIMTKCGLLAQGVWKMPTGLVLVGEDITEAAEREVLEETGLEATFEAILAIRQSHKAAFGKSDMFFAVALK